MSDNDFLGGDPVPTGSPPCPDGVTTWEEYVSALRTLRLWAGARGDGDLAAVVPGLTAAAVRGVLGEARRAVPDRRAVDLVVRACLLLRERPDEEIAAEQRRWRAAWDKVFAAVEVRRREPRSGRARGVAATVLLPAVTGVVVNLATSNTGNWWAWCAVTTVLVAHVSLLSLGPVRWVREPVPAVLASAVAIAVTVGLVLLLTVLPPPTDLGKPGARIIAPKTLKPCGTGKAAEFIGRPRDPDFHLTWEMGYVCPNLAAPVHVGPHATTRRAGSLNGSSGSIFLCQVKESDGYWYRTAADRKDANNGWGYVAQGYIDSAHPVPGLPACPG